MTAGSSGPATHTPSFGKRLLDWLACVWDVVEDFLYVFMPARFSALIIVVCGVLLILEPQSQDVLVSLGEDDRAWHWVWFYLAVTVWAAGGWYWARIVLSIRFKPPKPPTCKNPKFLFGQERRIRFLVAHTPRTLGAAGYLLVAWALERASDLAGRAGDSEAADALGWNVLIAVALAVGFYVLATYRRKSVNAAVDQIDKLTLPGTGWLKAASGALRIHPQPQTDIPRPRDLPKPTKVLFWIFVGMWVLLFILSVTTRYLPSLLLRPEAIFLIGVGLWIPLGSLLALASRKHDVPFITLLIVWGLFWSMFNDNHAVRAIEGNPAAGGYGADRPDVVTAFERWRDAAPEPGPDEKRKPMVIVASAGGGSRAAYWTATVLGMIQDRFRNGRNGVGFDQHLFGLSGVSGGSLGIAVYRALLAVRTAALKPCRDKRNQANAFAACGQSAVAADFLGPTLTAMLYPDLLQRLIPWPMLPDRAQGLETAWERAWRETLDGQSNLFAEGFSKLWAGGAANRWTGPALFLNGTSVKTGRRIVTSNLNLDGTLVDGIDLFANWTGDIPLSTAVNNSARFPYVEPAGTLEGGGRQDRIVDGGYFENFGASTVEDILYALKQNDPTVWVGIRPIVVQISSDPGYAGLREPACDAPAGDPMQADGGAPMEFASEALSPLSTLFNTRTARGHLAAASLKRTVCGFEGVHIHFRLCVEGKKDVEAPLGWALSQAAQDRIRTAWEECGNQEALARLMSAIGG